MEILGIILMLLTVLAAFIGVISLIFLIVMAISKKRLKVPGIITGSAFGVALLAFVSFIILVAVDPETYTAENNTNSDDEEVTYSQPNTGKSVEEPQRRESSATENTEFDDESEEVTEDLAEETPEIDPEDLSNYRTDIDIKDIERNPNEYQNEFITFEGKIIQVIEDDIYSL